MSNFKYIRNKKELITHENEIQYYIDLFNEWCQEFYKLDDSGAYNNMNSDNWTKFTKNLKITPLGMNHCSFYPTVFIDKSFDIEGYRESIKRAYEMKGLISSKAYKNIDDLYVMIFIDFKKTYSRDLYSKTDRDDLKLKHIKNIYRRDYFCSNRTLDTFQSITWLD
jgi:hypothetical protein